MVKGQGHNGHICKKVQTNVFLSIFWELFYTAFMFYILIGKDMTCIVF